LLAMARILRRIAARLPAVMRATDRPWNLRLWFFVTFTIIAAGMLFMGREIYFFTPLYETGDLAANSLQVDRAIHLTEISGNYSRFQFHHPGPAFFYVYGAAQVLFFDVLHLVPSPHNGQLLGAALLQSSFLALSISVMARFATPNRGLFTALAIGFALVHFRLAGNPEFSVWPPDQLVVPFAAFVVVSAGLATGWIELLPLVVFCGGFLVHGHVAQPLFVIPLAALALVLGAWHAFRRHPSPLWQFIRRNLPSSLAALAVLAVFLAPILIDAVHGPNSNLAAILRYFGQPQTASDAHSPLAIITYVVSFLGYPADLAVLDFSRSEFGSFLSAHALGVAVSVLVLAVLPLVLSVTNVRSRMAAKAGAGDETGGAGNDDSREPRLLGAFYAILALAFVLTLAWVALQRGPLYEFNSFFIYGLMYAAALPPLMMLSRRWSVGLVRPATALLVAVAVVLVCLTSLPLPMSEDPAGLAVNRDVQETVAKRSSSAPVLLEFRPSDWPTALAVALALDRSHVQWFVEPSESFLFGSEHVFAAGSGAAAAPPEKWYLKPLDPSHVGQVPMGPKLALYPPPPSVSP
jgi:hypothetical protein